MNVNLTPELEALVQRKVQTGRYNSASEVVREALRMMEQRDEYRAITKEEIRKKIDEGWDAARRGELFDGEEVFAELEAELNMDEDKTV